MSASILMRVVVLLVAFAFSTCTPLLSAAESAPFSVEERLARLEKAIARIEAQLGATAAAGDLEALKTEQAALAQSITKLAAPAPATVVKPAGKEKSFTLGGFLHAQAEFGGAPDTRYTGINNRFLLRRARLRATGVFTEDFSFKIEGEFGNNALAPKTSISAQMTDGYIAWTKFPAASVRIGQFKTPFGFEQLSSDLNNAPIERSLANDRLTLGRQIGMMTHGTLVEKRVNYSAGVFNGNGSNTGGNDNQKFLWVGRLSGLALDTTINNRKLILSAGANTYSSEDNGTFAGRRTGLGLDTQLTFGATDITAEWLKNDRHPFFGTDITTSGWSVMAAHFFHPQWQGLARYESYDANTDAPASTTTLWTIGVNYLILGDDLKLSLNYLSGDKPATADAHENRLISRLQVVF